MVRTVVFSLALLVVIGSFVLANKFQKPRKPSAPPWPEGSGASILRPWPSRASGTWTWPATGETSAYPEVVFGQKPWDDTSTTTRLPRKLSQLQSVVAHVNWTEQNVWTTKGYLNFDVWLVSSLTRPGGSDHLPFAALLNVMLKPYGGATWGHRVRTGVHLDFVAAPGTTPADCTWDVFYEPDKDDHGLAYNPYKSIVVPRPVGWISTLSRDGVVNLAYLGAGRRPRTQLGQRLVGWCGHCSRCISEFDAAGANEGTAHGDVACWNDPDQLESDYRRECYLPLCGGLTRGRLCSCYWPCWASTRLVVWEP